MTLQTREKESYHVQRVAFGTIEVNSMNKYVSQSEKKFNENWQQYANKLETHLTSGTDFRDWYKKKHPDGKTSWVHTKTLEESFEHPGIKVFK